MHQQGHINVRLVLNVIIKVKEKYKNITSKFNEIVL